MGSGLGCDAAGKMRRLPTLFLGLLLVQPSCGLFASGPDRVAKEFWEAVAAGELDGAKAFSTEADLRRLARLAERYAIEEVEVGSVLTHDSTAEVGTTLELETGLSVSFHTELRRYDEGWRVDAAASGQALRQAIVEVSLTELRESFRESAERIGEAVELGLEQAVDAMHEALGDPERGRPDRPPTP